MTDTVDTLVELLDFYLFLQNRICWSSMKQVFGEDMANHLLPKWEWCNGNVLNFMTVLDEKNQKKLIEYGVGIYESAI